MQEQKKRIRAFLKKNSGQSFTKLGVKDESNGKWVRENEILNINLVRHLKQFVVPAMATGVIGEFLYHDCRDLLNANRFWTTKKERIAFWYSWR